MYNEHKKIEPPALDDKAAKSLEESIAAAGAEESWTEDFKADIQKASDELAAEIAAWKEFWAIWMPGGLRKRKRFTTKGHGRRRGIRRRKNREARRSRKRNRPYKKRRR